MFPSRVFNADQGAVRVEGDQTRADIDGRNFLYFTIVTDRKLARAAADVDIQHDTASSGGMSHGAGAMRRHGCFESVARADSDKLADLLDRKSTRLNSSHDQI